MRISTAGNIEPPLFDIIIRKGFSIEIINDIWCAKKTNIEFRGDSILELAAIILLYETKGENWKVSDKGIDEYLNFLKINEK